MSGVPSAGAMRMGGASPKPAMASTTQMQQQQQTQPGSAYQDYEKPPGSKALAAAPVEPQSQNVTVAEAMSPQAFRGTMSFAVGTAIVGIILAITSSQVTWLAIGEPDQPPELLYAPFKFQECDYKYRCKDAELSACDALKRLQKSTKRPLIGDFCNLDENLKGLVIATAVLSCIALIILIYIMTVGSVASKNSFYLAGFISLGSVGTGIGALAVCGSIKSIPLLTQYGGIVAKNDSGFITEAVAFVMFLIVGGVAFAQSIYAPAAAVNPHAVPEGTAVYATAPVATVQVQSDVQPTHTFVSIPAPANPNSVEYQQSTQLTQPSQQNPGQMA
ncbi:hypothetical protein HDU97_004956 [Phlyctochytrium planicorne]|nr:hypothetical protein HDU97_004956 [Phlyctochytrium planicorne]